MRSLIYNREKEPIQDMLNVIDKAEQEGRFPITLEFPTPGKAEYIKQRCYQIRKALRREAFLAEMPRPIFSSIRQDGNTLTFKKGNVIIFKVVPQKGATT